MTPTRQTSEQSPSADLHATLQAQGWPAVNWKGMANHGRVSIARAWAWVGGGNTFRPKKNHAVLVVPSDDSTPKDCPPRLKPTHSKDPAAISDHAFDKQLTFFGLRGLQKGLRDTQPCQEIR